MFSVFDSPLGMSLVTVSNLNRS